MKLHFTNATRFALFIGISAIGAALASATLYRNHDLRQSGDTAFLRGSLSGRSECRTTYSSHTLSFATPVGWCLDETKEGSSTEFFFSPRSLPDWTPVNLMVIETTATTPRAFYQSRCTADPTCTPGHDWYVTASARTPVTVSNMIGVRLHDVSALVPTDVVVGLFDGKAYQLISIQEQAPDHILDLQVAFESILESIKIIR